MQNAFQRGWRDLQLELEERQSSSSEAESTNCPDCRNRLYFLEGGVLCPVCGFSTETLYTQ